MEILVAVLVITIAGLAVFFKIALSFGGVKAFLAKELKSDRAALSAARKTAKSLAKAAAGELKSAVKKVSECEKAYLKKISLAEAEHQFWANPGNGKSLIRLGKVTLYEHMLTMGSNTVDLAGVTVDTKITDMSALLVISLPNGMKLTESFDTSWKEGETKHSTSSHKDWDILESSTEKTRSFSPDQIIHLATEINNQVVRREEFQRRRPQMMEATTKNIEFAKSDTADFDQAKRELESLEAGSQSAMDAKSAAEALVTAEDVYKKAVSEILTKKD
jgi:hypothetical protein